MVINNETVEWSQDKNIPNENIPNDVDIIKGGSVQIQGSPIQTWSLGIRENWLDKDKIEDIMICIQYKVSEVE